jgi:hypothetical protein
MMTTSERTALPHRPRIRLSGLEWKLYLTTLLAGAYCLAWVGFAGRVPRSSTRASVPAGARDRFVWISDLPASDRPTVALPPGWIVAVASDVRMVPVRKKADTRTRIRTRTS